MADWGKVMDGSMFYGHSEYLVLYVGLVVLFKVFATSATNGAGGCGGTFAPSLFIGGFAGFFSLAFGIAISWAFMFPRRILL